MTIRSLRRRAKKYGYKIISTQRGYTIVNPIKRQIICYPAFLTLEGVEKWLKFWTKE